jgi:glucosamine kinase
MDNGVQDILIGIDGGGSSCRFALLHGGQRHEVALGPANVYSDRQGAIARSARASPNSPPLSGADLRGARSTPDSRAS